MGQLILRRTDGTEVPIRESVHDFLQPLDVIIRDECLAVTVWTNVDVQTALKEVGYEGTDEQVDAVIDRIDPDALSDCSDGDWQIIYDAIECAKDEL